MTGNKLTTDHNWRRVMTGYCLSVLINLENYLPGSVFTDVSQLPLTTHACQIIAHELTWCSMLTLMQAVTPEYSCLSHDVVGTEANRREKSVITHSLSYDSCDFCVADTNMLIEERHVSHLLQSCCHNELLYSSKASS